MVCCIIGELAETGTENHPMYVSHRMELLETLDNMMQNGVNTFYMALEAGYELWCARLILGLKSKHPMVRLICVIDDLDNHDEAQRIVLDKADLVTFVAGSVDERRRYMALRSEYMLNLYSDGGYINNIVECADSNNHWLTIVKPI